jgi:ABC-type cobalamin/Fe3+-siderophores transport system ATPase subunit
VAGAGERIAEGDVHTTLTREQLEALYRASVERVMDSKSGARAFLPG